MKRALGVLTLGLMAVALATPVRADVPPPKGSKRVTLDHKIMLLLGSDKTAERLKRGETGSEINDSLRSELEAFRKIREKYLLY